ncbi:MAG: hypothetical protein MRY79_01810 [Alphaproteobacteria bacterium]|nr:hypothetical protein [Alphaproteobacteria bacterium]
MNLQAVIEILKRNKIGAAILGVGVLTFLFVLYLAYQTFFGVPADDAGPKLSRSEINEFKTLELEDLVQEQPQEQEKPAYKPKKSITERQMLGNWETRVEEGRALLQLQGGTYRLVIIRDNPAASRWYSNGYYELREGGLLMLKPNLDWGPPKSNKYSYRLLTRAKIPVIASLYKGRLVWQVPGPNVDVYVPNTHPFLSLASNDIAFWKVLK